MKPGYTRLVVTAAIAVLVIVAGSPAALAQSCSSSPNYLPDFTSNQGCLSLNNNGIVPGYPGFYPAVSGAGTVLRATPNQTWTAGSAWYNTQQSVLGSFSTTFAFQISGGTSSPADGIAFVIQNSPAGTSALGPNGCGIGFGDSESCTPPTGGIPNSLAVEFNTALNSGVDPSSSDVSIQNCGGTGANSVDPSCRIAVNDLTQLTPPINIADGNVHTVTITYSGPGSTLFDVILDNVDLFPVTLLNPTGGVLFDITTIGLNSGNAWVGFTAATGSWDDNQDILSWTFQPGSQTAVINQNQPTYLTFP
jgi:hypothetical protein